MEIEYGLTEQDLIAFQRYHARNPPHPQQRGGPTTALVGGLVFLLIITAALLVPLSDDPTAAWWLLHVPFAVLGAAAMLLGLIVYARLTAPRQMARALAQGRNAEKLLGWRRVAINAEAIRNTSEFAASTYLWHGIDAIGATPDHAFLYINTATAVIVPGRAFRDDRAFQDFVDAARDYYRGGGAAPDPRGGWAAPRPGGVVAPDPSGGPPDDRIFPDKARRP